ncbi:hypothetical protein GCM10010517_71630 [Streptosporangium fragile]|uniref:Uncharacterized protein n=1 Tax=Streptosporangium fragile TaxID=46186 RepID=A0ABP6IQS0_9ACTN
MGDACEEGHNGSAMGVWVWVVPAEKGTAEPTSLTYEQALEEALRYGWIDGPARSRDASTYSQRYTPRRIRSDARHVGRDWPARPP